MICIYSFCHNVAVGKVILKDKEHLVLIRPYQRGLVMHILHYLYEIRPADEIPELTDTKKVSLDSTELSLGKLLYSMILIR